MKLIWKNPAVKSLFKLDLWRRDNGWEPISSLLVEKMTENDDKSVQLQLNLDDRTTNDKLLKESNKRPNRWPGEKIY